MRETVWPSVFEKGTASAAFTIEKAENRATVTPAANVIRDGKTVDLSENVKNAWQGDNAQKYVQKARQMKPKMIKASDDLKEVASTIRTVAKNTYDAEMKAYEIANERSY